MAFKKGEKRPEAAGRKKGSINKTTASVKAALEEAFEGVGGIDALIRFGESNPAAFYALWGKLIPSEIKAVVTTPTRPRVTRIVIEHHVAKESDTTPGEPPARSDGGRGTQTGVPPGPDAGLGEREPIHPDPGGYSFG